jgi:hypothetical protein
VKRTAKREREREREKREREQYKENKNWAMERREMRGVLQCSI